MNTAQTTMSTPKETNAERRARREREDYEDRLKSNAEEAAKEFAEIKAQAFKLKAEAQAAITEAGVALARVKAYENHVEETNKKNKEYGTNYYPKAYSVWGWEECVLCHNEIRDDPHGHNPEPLANGVCCTECNKEVQLARCIQGFYKPPEEEDQDGDWEWCSGCDTTLYAKDLAEGKKCSC
jgi:hypothetical protein